MTDIAHVQNQPVSLEYRRASGFFYRRGGVIYFGGANVTIALALISPLVLLFQEDLGPLLGAIAGLWIFVSRLFLDSWRRSFQWRGAVAQEHFDTRVLGLPWNDALTARLPPEDLHAAGKTRTDADETNWYPASADLPWPLSVVVCQRSNAVWARRQHRRYAATVALAAGVWFVLGVAIALLDDASLADYLVIIALPSLPAFLDATDIYRAHAAAAEARSRVEAELDQALEAGTTEADTLREVQDQLFTMRFQAPPVPQWFYRLLRADFEDAMRHAAEGFAGQKNESGKDV